MFGGTESVDVPLLRRLLMDRNLNLGFETYSVGAGTELKTDYPGTCLPGLLGVNLDTGCL